MRLTSSSLIASAYTRKWSLAGALVSSVLLTSCGDQIPETVTAPAVKDPTNFANAGETHGPLTTYPGQAIGGHVILCKDASSPPRRGDSPYNFTIISSGTIAGDVAQTDAQLLPGQCRIVFSRTAFSNVTVTLTITEFVGPFGFIVHSITRTQFGNTAVFAGPSPTISVQANSSHGGVVTFTNAPAIPPG